MGGSVGLTFSLFCLVHRHPHVLSLSLSLSKLMPVFLYCSHKIIKNDTSNNYVCVCVYLSIYPSLFISSHSNDKSKPPFLQEAYASSFRSNQHSQKAAIMILRSLLLHPSLFSKLLLKLMSFACFNITITDRYEPAQLSAGAWKMLHNHRILLTPGFTQQTL